MARLDGETSNMAHQGVRLGARARARPRGDHERSELVVSEKMVTLAGLEPALLAELDFESSASTNSATGA